MPDNWIGNIRITDETEVLDSTGTKIHDYISCDQGAGVVVDKEVYPVLWEKLGGQEGDLHWSAVSGLHQFNLFSRDIDASQREWFSEKGGTITCTAAGTMPKTYPTSPIHGEHIKVVGDAPASYFQLNYYGSMYGSLSSNYVFERMLRINSGTGSLYIFRLPNVNGQAAVILNLLADGSVQLSYDGSVLGTSVEVINYGNTNHFCIQRVIGAGSLEVYLNGIKVIDVAVPTLATTTCVLDLNWHGNYGTTHVDVEFYGQRFTNGLRYTGNYTVEDAPYAVQAVTPNVPDMPTATGSPWPYKIVADKT